MQQPYPAIAKHAISQPFCDGRICWEEKRANQTADRIASISRHAETRNRINDPNIRAHEYPRPVQFYLLSHLGVGGQLTISTCLLTPSPGIPFSTEPCPRIAIRELRTSAAAAVTFAKLVSTGHQMTPVYRCRCQAGPHQGGIYYPTANHWEATPFPPPFCAQERTLP